ncbi:DUF4097 family beta strand repeat-containing protein [Saccharothrix isguenensis]
MVKRIALTAVVVVAAAVALTSCVRLVQSGFDDQHSVTGQVAEVRLQNGSGDVLVRSRAGGGGDVEVRRHVSYPKDANKPEGISHRMEGSTLVLDGCGNRCSVDYEVTVPSEDVRISGVNDSGDVRLEGVAAVEVEVGSGNATVRDVSGVVRVDIGSGDLDVADVGGDSQALVGSGNARLANMRGAVTVDAHSGDVDVQMAAVLSVRAETGSGNLTVKVPKGAYKVNVGASSGDKEVEIANDPNASAELVLHAGSGDVTLRAA